MILLLLGCTQGLAQTDTTEADPNKNPQRKQRSRTGGGVIQGKVIDQVTREPLPGATVQVVGTGLGGFTNNEGIYTIRQIPFGPQTVKATYLGYGEVVRNQVLVEAGVTEVNFELQPQGTQGETVEITSSAFSKSSQNLSSFKTVGVEVIRSNPGGNFDISKVVQSLPGVSGSVGFRNDIIVRGGGPNENVFYLDDIEVPIINHFATQGSGGGPVGIINAQFIENVKFQSSGFGAQYDNTLSSVLDFSFREGNRERFQTTVQVGASEAGVTFDTPIGQDITALVSVRRSYLQLLFQALEQPFLPSYWDFQGKVNWTINDKTSLSLLGLGAIDRFEKNDPEDVDPEVRYQLDGLPVFNQDNYTVGLRLKHLLKNGFVSVALSRNWLYNREFRDDTLGVVNLDYRSVEAENKLRVNTLQKFGEWQVRYGGVVQLAEFGLESAILNGETQQFDSSQSSLQFIRYGFHGSVARTFFGRLEASLGVRVDMNSFTRDGHNPLNTLSPRFSLGYTFRPGWKATFSSGIYYKLPPYVFLGFGRGEDLPNQDLDYIRSTHVAGGVEWTPNESWLVSVEGFFKYYQNYPVSVDDSLNVANQGGDFGPIGNENVASVGLGRTYGLELFAQKVLTKRLFGIVSYTLYWSEFTGFDQDNYLPSAWDNRHLLSITGGYLLGKNKSWEIAAKLRVLGPSPYTPWDSAASVQTYQETGVGVLDFSRINAESTPAFTQLDIRIDKKWYFKRWSLNLYLDIQNVLNIANQQAPFFTLRRNPDGSFVEPPEGQLVTEDQGTIIPSLGVIIKF